MSMIALCVHTTQEIQERFQAWSLHTLRDEIGVKQRETLWGLYCDARDSLPDGTTQRRSESRGRPCNDHAQGNVVIQTPPRQISHRVRRDTRNAANAALADLRDQSK